MKRFDEKHYDIEIGKQLKTLRKIRKMSQEDLAAQSGITFQQIQKYEKGINRIAASRLYQFTHILDISPLYFFEKLPTKCHYCGNWE